MKPSQHEVVVITGASAGVGRATAHEFARHGASVGLLARGAEALEATKREIEQRGGRAIAIPTDVADPHQVQCAADAVEEQLGPIDIWINNAMVSVFSPVHEMTPEEFRRVTEVTYLGHVHGTLAALQWMRPRDRGTIVQVGSALAYRGIPLQSAYCAAKHAIQGFTESLECELRHDRSRVHVISVHLPALNTPQFGWVKSRLPRKAQPVEPIFQPEVAAKAIHWAAHRRQREVHVGWPTVKTIWGNKLVPWYVMRELARTGFDAQQTDEPEDANRPHNLWSPVPGQHATHGAFDDRAADHSVHFAFSRRRWPMALGAAALLGIVVGEVLRR